VVATHLQASQLVESAELRGDGAIESVVLHVKSSQLSDAAYLRWHTAKVAKSVFSLRIRLVRFVR
jgi:hypothetical protein